MRDFREPIQRGGLQAAIDQQGVVVAHESKADNSDGGEYRWPNDTKPLALVALQICGYVGSLDED